MSSPVKFIDNRQYHKSNYSDALKYIIPNLYFEEDYALKDKQIDILDQIINSHLNVIGNISSIINVSSIPGSIYSSLNTAEGISKFFVKQNNLTNISIDDFEKLILLPLNNSFRNFNSSSQFSDYLKNTLLPGIRLNKPTLDFLDGGSVSANHDYLVTNLSWLYFLNLSGPPSLTYNPSSFVHDILIENTYNAKTINLNDAMRGLSYYIWKNYLTKPAWQSLNILPNDFTPLSSITNTTWTSGTQQLEKLCTLIDVVYSPLYIDDGDVKVKDAINDYLNTSYLLTDKKLQGPFLKLLKAFSFAFADYSNQVDRLEILNDLDNCPDDYLPLLADLIGWNLFGTDPGRWRLQLANAVNIYKMVGTKKSIQFIANSVFGQDVFNVSSNIFELWESYVPYLIYYALATESSLLKDFTTWNSQLANNLGCGFSFSSMDDNLKYCTDKIIKDLVYQFNSQFLLNSKPFPLDTENFVFNYRNKQNPIPPFEEIPYYLDVIITEEMLESISDRLVCFGVREDFANQLIDYIRSHTIDALEDYSIRNSWLMFTPSAEYAPNWDSVIENISNNKVEYLSLWNGKSSYFQVLFDASSFDFTKTSLEADSKEVLKITSQAINNFSPAKSVPNVTLRASTEDDYLSDNITFPYLGLDKVDYASLKYTSGAALAGFGMSALVMGTYKRGLTPTSVNSFGRLDVDSLQDNLISSQGTVANLPRRNHRRRNYKLTLPRDGYYDRTGFNMPTPLNSYSANGYNFLPLGLIPSSQTYVTIPNYSSIPDIYSKCEGLNSSSVYSGLIVSNTYPIRGWRGIESNAKINQLGRRPDYYFDYGQLHPIMAVMHYIGEQSKILQASSYYYSNPEEFTSYGAWQNILQNYANSSTEFNKAFPSSYNDYINFSFGREFHKLFNIYTHEFQRHTLDPRVMYLDGPTIFGHALGSVLYNSNLNKNGSFASANPQVITSSFADVVEHKAGLGLFSYEGIASGSYIASSDLYLNSYEYRSSGILDGIELSQTSGTSTDNSFSIIRLNKSNKIGNRYNSLFHENTVIRQRSTDGFGRIIFDISKYSPDISLGYKGFKNFLIPEHKFKLNFKSLIINDNGESIGGDSVGIWIHTKPENGKIWSYTKNKIWIQHDVSSLNSNEVIDNYSHIFGSNESQRDLSSLNINCNLFQIQSNTNRVNDLLASIQQSEFNNFELEFNTENILIEVPSDYHINISQQVHRLDQNYVIEIFTNSTRSDRSTLFYDINLIDQTLNTWSKPLVDKKGCKEFRVDLSKPQVMTIIKYFNELTGAYSKFGYASRVASYTSGVYEVSGGSRINHMESPEWMANTKLSGYNLLKEITFTN
jgi:hypothetical protein